MSYILDSLKKSDKERRSIDNPTSIVMRAPPFLENDKRKSGNKWLIIFSVVVVLLAVAYYFFPHLERQRPPLYTAETPEKSVAVKTAERVNPVSSKEKEQAVLLYKQALAGKSQPEIDSLYQKLDEEKEGETVSVEQLASIAQKNEVSPETETSIVSALLQKAEPVVEEALEPSNRAEPEIPSIYEIDAYVRKTIPSVDYGAHIYATDNNSGFVILDGARRRVGDKLGSGLYVEKIKEESVVLSYEGTLFSLPAMKSWKGK